MSTLSVFEGSHTESSPACSGGWAVDLPICTNYRFHLRRAFHLWQFWQFWQLWQFSLSLYTASMLVPVWGSPGLRFPGPPLFCPQKPYQNLIWALFRRGHPPTPLHPRYTLNTPWVHLLSLRQFNFRVQSGKWENQMSRPAGRDKKGGS